jgi:hypothetical protein
MGASEEKQVDRSARMEVPSGLTGSQAADLAFRAMVKQLHCPSCGEGFTDGAVDWSDIWLEGRFDLLKQLGQKERDGPCKLRCERCGHRSWLDYFAQSVTSAGHGDD